MRGGEPVLRPEEIERRSFAIIEQLLGKHRLEKEQAPVMKRVIHTTADFDYVDNLVFSPGAVYKGIEALRAGAHIVCDTNMVKAGINGTALAKLGIKTHCFMTDEEVIVEAGRRGITRAAVSMEKAVELPMPLLFAIGNAPTALMRLHEICEAEKLLPSLIIGVPVGFVNVEESKELFLGGSVPYIIARGRKGGSNVAAAICNALLYQATGMR